MDCFRSVRLACCALFFVWTAGCAAPPQNDSPTGAAARAPGHTLYQPDSTGGAPSLKTGAPVLRTGGAVIASPLPESPAHGSAASEKNGANNSGVYRLRPGDPVLISLRGIPNPEEMEERIDENGNINLPYIGAIRAAGCTIADLEELIEQRYVEEQIYRRVTANVVPAAQSYFVRGEVKQPGRFPLVGGVTILQAIATAGGFTEFANPKRVRVIRGDNTFYRNAREIEEAPEKDEVLEAGDVIVVTRSVF